MMNMSSTNKEDSMKETKVKLPERATQVLHILQSAGDITIDEISERTRMTPKNISSWLLYLRFLGYDIGTDGLGQKYLK